MSQLHDPLLNQTTNPMMVPMNPGLNLITPVNGVNLQQQLIQQPQNLQMNNQLHMVNNIQNNNIHNDSSNKKIIYIIKYFY